MATSLTRSSNDQNASNTNFEAQMTALETRMTTFLEARMTTFDRDLRLRDIRQEMFNVKNQQQQHQHARAIAELQGRRVEVIKDVVFAGGKLVIKLGTKEIVFFLGKQFSVAIAKQAALTTAKIVIPVVSVIIGVGLAVRRVLIYRERGDKAELLKAGGEVVSGIFACFPGIGTAISVGIDMAMGGHDIYANVSPSPNSFVHTINNSGTLTLKEAYQALKISKQDPTQQEVDAIYRSIQEAAHPDPAAQLMSNDERQDYTALSQFVNQCRDTIYRERHWAMSS